MHVLNIEFHCGTIGRLQDPEVKVLVLSCLEEKNVVAVIQLSNFVELVQVLLGIEFGLFSSMWHQVCQILNQVTMPVSDASGRDDKHSLAVNVFGFF